MTNWKKFKIVSISTSKEEIAAFDLIVFSLDKHFDYSKPTYIFCTNCYPFNTCKVGDYLEIDLDKIGNYKNGHEFDDTSVVRKFGSSAVVPSSSGGLTIPTTPSSAVEVARTVTQTVLEHADRTGGIPQIEIGTDKTSIRYYPPKK